MLGALILGGLSLAGALGKGIGGLFANKAREKQIDKAEQDNQAWYDRRYNEDATQRGDAQRLLSITEDTLKRRAARDAGAAAVMGASAATAAATKAANNAVLGDAISQINAQNFDRKDQIEDAYRTRKQSLEDQRAGLAGERATNIANAGAGVADAAGKIASAFI